MQGRVERQETCRLRESDHDAHSWTKGSYPRRGHPGTHSVSALSYPCLKRTEVSKTENKTTQQLNKTTTIKQLDRYPESPLLTTGASEVQKEPQNLLK